jgi:hypothetical protein
MYYNETIYTGIYYNYRIYIIINLDKIIKIILVIYHFLENIRNY